MYFQMLIDSTAEEWETAAACKPELKQLYTLAVC